jgi:Acetoacetate decarboxylase (ADC)
LHRDYGRGGLERRGHAVIDFWAAPEAVEMTLPPGLAASSEDPGQCTAFFAEWQFRSGGGRELEDPVRSQYREFFVAMRASRHGDEVFTCPYIWVDQDVSMLRGWIQGFPKKLGSVHMTRALELPGAASTPIRAGTTFAGTCSAAGERVATATLTLEAPQREAGAAERPHPRLVNVRKFPRLEAGHHGDPAVYELVSPIQRDTIVSETWGGAATLRIEDVTAEDIGLLRPIRVGRGRRYSSTFTVDDLEVLEDLR